MIYHTVYKPIILWNHIHKPYTNTYIYHNNPYYRLYSYIKSFLYILLSYYPWFIGIYTYWYMVYMHNRRYEMVYICISIR